VLWLEVAVAERVWRRAARADREGLVLCGEVRATTCGAVRVAELELVDERNREPGLLAQAPCTGDAVVPVPPLVCAEQRAAVITDQCIDDVAVHDVEVRDREVAVGTLGRQAGIRLQA